MLSLLVIPHTDITQLICETSSVESVRMKGINENHIDVNKVREFGKQSDNAESSRCCLSVIVIFFYMDFGKHKVFVNTQRLKPDNLWKQITGFYVDCGFIQQRRSKYSQWLWWRQTNVKRNTNKLLHTNWNILFEFLLKNQIIKLDLFSFQQIVVTYGESHFHKCYLRSCHDKTEIKFCYVFSTAKLQVMNYEE